MREETKICKHCRSEIPKKAKVCPQCRKKQGGKMKWIIITVVVLLIIGAAAGGGGGESEQSSDAPSENQNKKASYVKESDIDKVYTDADSYEGEFLKIKGKVFSVEKDNDYIYLQVFRDIENADQNTMVRYADSSAEISEDDYVEIDGEIIGKEDGENLFGGTVTALMMEAKSVKKISYKDAVHPAIKEITSGESVENDGFKMTLEKVEFAEKQTRIYITFENNGSEEFYINSYSAKITQGSKQYEPETDYESDYEELQTDVLPGISTSGIITFAGMNSNEPFNLYIDGYGSESYEDYPFEFAVSDSAKTK